MVVIELWKKTKVGILIVLEKMLSAFEKMKSAPLVYISKIEKSCDGKLLVKWIAGIIEKQS